MKIGNTNFHITKTRKGEYWTNMFDNHWRKTLTSEEERVASIICNMCRKRSWSEEYKTRQFNIICEAFHITLPESKPIVEENVKVEANENYIKDTIQKLINFFTEFDFEPNYRFVNTFAYACNTNCGQEYVSKYFELIDSAYLNGIREKMKSSEFTDITNFFKEVKPNHKVNNRFKLYYGSQGTGKTTEAMKETEGNCMVCHSAMLPSDLMEDFKFNEGKAEFTPSALQIAMTEGKQIVLDEINLLPFESLRFLQSILDGKKEFLYKGKTIEIKDGFKIIGTMNLTVNGSVYSLPEPLVDRCEEIRKYSLSAENLMGAIL